MSESPVVSDPRALRAIAHPTRSRILSELSASGPARAADLARDLGIPANQASFHLRHLAKYGLVEEAPELARDRRDRVWQASADHGYVVDLGSMHETSGGAAAVSVFKNHIEARAAFLVRRALNKDDAESDGDGQRRTITDSAIRLTTDERDQFAAEINELIERWADRAKDRSVPRDTYSFFMVFQPYPPLGSESEGEPAADETDQRG